MAISSNAVGTIVGPRVFAMQPRYAMAYAAALGDHNPLYFDDTRPGGVIAPPMLGVRLDWPLRPVPGAMIPAITPEDARQGVHATQDMIFHRLIRGDDVLTTTGQLVLVAQRPPGAYLVTRYDTYDTAGAPVLTVFYGSIYRGVPCDGPPQIMDALPLLPAPPPAAAPIWQSCIDITPTLPHLYTECADIWNPIHTERSVALAAGLPGIILHGTATLALAVREVINRAAGGDPQRLARLSCRFGAMVIPGTQITVALTAETPTAEGKAVFFMVTNAEGGPAIRDGVALLR